jgi:hypothetical protein
MATMTRVAVSFGHHAFRHAVALLVGMALAAPAAAVDLIEPWEQGFSELELSAVRGDASQGGLLLGGGIGRGFSLGVSMASAGGDDSQVGLVLVWSRHLGVAIDVDLWAQAAGPTSDFGLGRTETDLGAEWSIALPRWTPYARLGVGHGGGETVGRPLLGAMLPVGETRWLLEICAMRAGRGPLPWRLTLGPKLPLTDALAVLPEVSLSREDGSRATRTIFGLSLVTSPRALRSAVRAASGLSRSDR